MKSLSLLIKFQYYQDKDKYIAKLLIWIAVSIITTLSAGMTLGWKPSSYEIILINIFSGNLVGQGSNMPNIVSIVPYLVGMLILVSDISSELNGYGKQVLMRTGKKIDWWLSKCFYLTIKTICVLFVFYLFVFLTSLFFYGGFTASEKEVCELYTLENYNINWVNLRLTVFAMPLLAITACTLLQASLSLFKIYPVIAYLIEVIIFIASTYVDSKWLFVSYTMSMRILFNSSQELNFKYAISETLVIAVLSIVIGIIAIRKRDIY
jgi:hypothetical protein